ncbi:hypothetical protein [Nakamurella endophytica]|uniref:Uncharacterized protein n=1 Tax=Nakamurella endophytica TaxID=1748367 RepID=A0A917STP7_9ACTN|nr:hypothetical protein [Nakamurella endophytica]GGL97265.1 hypothetical protein GCM10011594_16220 [Nakamurella endophytica]
MSVSFSTRSGPPAGTPATARLVAGALPPQGRRSVQVRAAAPAAVPQQPPHHTSSSPGRGPGGLAGRMVRAVLARLDAGLDLHEAQGVRVHNPGRILGRP